MVVAHPDDEAIGAGGQLHRFKNLTLVIVSDGAPRAGRDMRRTDHASIEDYARTRRTELMNALQASNLSDDALILPCRSSTGSPRQNFCARALRVFTCSASPEE